MESFPSDVQAGPGEDYKSYAYYNDGAIWLEDVKLSDKKGGGLPCY